MPARNEQLDGKDISALLTGGPDARTPHEALFIRYAGNELQTVISPQWKLLLPHSYRTLGEQPKAKDGIPAKYRMVKLAKPELYNMATDPAESKDVSAQFPGVVEKMLALAAENRAALGDTLTQTKGTENRPVGKAE